jgi:alkylation response protein AidB-like acyl-CoA dehydrogenase
MTEAGGGSDVLGGIRATAVVDGDDFIINGEKMFTSAAHIADYIIVTCITDPNVRRTDGLSQIIVDAKNTPGIEVRPIPKMAIRASGFNVVSFTDVRAPRSNLLGKLNQGWWQEIKGHNRHRLIGSAQALGLAWAAYRDSVSYAKDRCAFGRSIAHYQVIQRYLVEMAIEIDMARNYLYRTAWMACQERDVTTEVLMLNKFSSEIAYKTVGNAMSIHGAYGLTTEYDIQRYYRDVRHFVTTPMTNEMTANRLAIRLGLPKSY